MSDSHDDRTDADVERIALHLLPAIIAAEALDVGLDDVASAVAGLRSPVPRRSPEMQVRLAFDYAEMFAQVSEERREAPRERD